MSAEEQSKDLVAGERSFRLAEGSVARTGLEVRARPQPGGVQITSNHFFLCRLILLTHCRVCSQIAEWQDALFEARKHLKNARVSFTVSRLILSQPSPV